MNKTTKMLHMESYQKITTILSQVADMIKVLQQHEEPCHLDLQQLPLSVEELDQLGDILGEGSVHAEVEHMGVSRIYATSIPSVWRVIHFDDNGAVLSDFLEVSYCPEIIITPDDEIPIGLQLLKAKIFEMGMKERKEGRQ